MRSFAEDEQQTRFDRIKERERRRRGEREREKKKFDRRVTDGNTQ